MQQVGFSTQHGAENTHKSTTTHKTHKTQKWWSIPSTTGSVAAGGRGIDVDGLRAASAAADAADAEEEEEEEEGDAEEEEEAAVLALVTVCTRPDVSPQAMAPADFGAEEEAVGMGLELVRSAAAAAAEDTSSHSRRSLAMGEEPVNLRRT